MITSVTIGISPCVIWEIKRTLHVCTYLYTDGLWIESANGNEKEWKKME